MAKETSCRVDPDVHISVQFHGIQLDFAARLSAALVLIQESLARHYFDHVVIVGGSTVGLPRLPNERLYIAG
ncbi:hypothetical protein [Nocardia sp. NPDC057668]|uniref:hypothetical protein n=1 Tax=Nocardia sp. NPDC057668 TaxID=3346202 RepID=UPI00366BFBA1